MYVEVNQGEVAVVMRKGHFQHVVTAYRSWAEDIEDAVEKQRWLDLADCVEEQIQTSSTMSYESEYYD